MIHREPISIGIGSGLWTAAALALEQPIGSRWLFFSSSFLFECNSSLECFSHPVSILNKAFRDQLAKIFIFLTIFLLHILHMMRVCWRRHLMHDRVGLLGFTWAWGFFARDLLASEPLRTHIYIHTPTPSLVVSEWVCRDSFIAGWQWWAQGICEIVWSSPGFLQAQGSSINILMNPCTHLKICRSFCALGDLFIRLNSCVMHDEREQAGTFRKNTRLLDVPRRLTRQNAHNCANAGIPLLHTWNTVICTVDFSNDEGSKQRA